MRNSKINGFKKNHKLTMLQLYFVLKFKLFKLLFIQKMSFIILY